MHNDKSDHEFHEDLEALEHAKTLRYEHRELDMNKVGKFITAFFIFTAVFFVLSFLAMVTIQKLVAGRTPMEVEANVPRDLPAKAPLQNNITAWKDMADLRIKEEAAVNRIGPFEGKPNTYSIPVDAAMERIAQTGPEALEAR